jgi:uncharacterized membrane protein YcaP (DUF421 family)
VDIVLRAVAAYVFIIFVLRIIGRRELSSLGTSDIVLLVVMGDMIQNGVTQTDYSITGVFLAISTFAILTVALSTLAFSSRRARTLIEGEPVILLQDGKPIARNLRAERVSVEEIAEEARAEGIDSIDKIRWCVLEPSGRMSFIRQ